MKRPQWGQIKLPNAKGRCLRVNPAFRRLLPCERHLLGKWGDVAYAPYGEKYSDTGTQDLNFTGQNQDTASYLYDFLYREYHPPSGRWISPDRAGLAAVDATSPQTWNRYAYVKNNPLSNTDPLGLFDDAIGNGCNNGYLCGSFSNFYQGQLDASNRNIDFSFERWADWNDRQTFGDHYYDLPGHNNPIQQALDHYIAHVNLAFAQANVDPRELHLNLESDCVRANGTREIQYSLDDSQGHAVSGFWVTEHHTDWSLTKPYGPAGPGTTSQGPNPYGLSGFYDVIGGFGFHDSVQWFTVSRNKPAKSVEQYPTFVRTPRGDFGKLGIYIQAGAVYVNSDASEPVCPSN
jgi:RHS repeat-associated protein